MKYTSHTIYRGEHDPARGWRPDMVGITFKPTPNLTKVELAALIAELQAIKDDMVI